MLRISTLQFGPHSRLYIMALRRPSSAGRWVPCPGSIKLESAFPPTGEDDPMTLEGSFAHAIACDVFKRYQVGEVPVDSDYLGSIDDKGVVVTPDMWGIINVYIREVLRSIGGRDNIQLLQVEERVDISLPDPNGPVCFTLEGTPDLRYVKDDTLHVWDYKHGWGIVEAYYNWQLVCYAVGICQMLGASAPYKIALHVVQPRPYHVDGPVRTWNINPTILRECATKIGAAIRSSMMVDPPLKPGRHCRDCDASTYCPALGESIYTMLDYAGRSLPRVLQGGDLGKHLTCLKDLKTLVDERLESIEGQVLDAITSGNSVPGWEGARGRTKREWNVGVDTVKLIGEYYGVDTVKSVPITPIQAESAGVSPFVVQTFERRIPGSLRLVPQRLDKTAEKVFDKSVNKD